MKLETAQHLAESLRYLMQPVCSRVEVAGSIRRKCAEVGDIELVAIPKFEEREVPGSLFEHETKRVNLLTEWCDTEAKIDWHKRGEKQRSGVTQVMKVKVDLFICNEENWGYIFLLRTGSDEFMKAVVTYARKVGLYFDKGQLWNGSTPLPTPDEESVFAHLKLQFQPPERRTSKWAVRPLKVKSSMPRLSVDLPHERRPDVCQSCGIKGAIHDVDESIPVLTRWREHDENDRPERLIVVLCEKCSKKLIKPHARLYEDLQDFAPFPGAMPVCVNCLYHVNLRCVHPRCKWNGGEGLPLEMPAPIRVCMTRQRGANVWRGPVVCKAREELEAEPVNCIETQGGALDASV